MRAQITAGDRLSNQSREWLGIPDHKVHELSRREIRLETGE
jgi:hypothetical protein